MKINAQSLPIFTATGGTLSYEPVFDAEQERIVFVAYGTLPDGSKVYFTNNRTGEVRQFYVFKALLNFHREHFPNEPIIRLSGIDVDVSDEANANH